MPVVEEAGMIKSLGDWVLETAARQLKDWHDQGFLLETAGTDDWGRASGSAGRFPPMNSKRDSGISERGEGHSPAAVLAAGLPSFRRFAPQAIELP